MKNLFSAEYNPDLSFVHRMDSRIKLFITFFMLVFTLISFHPIMYIANAVLLLLFTLVSKTKISHVLRSVGKLWFLMAVVFVMNSIFYNDGEVLFTIGKIAVFKDGFLQGLHIIANIVFILCWFSLLMAVTSPMELTEGIRFYLSPLGYLHINTETIALIISVSVSFVPILFDEAEKIKKAQIARGAMFESVNPIKRGVSVISLLVPIFVSAFKRADEMSQALEARGYRGGISNEKQLQ